MRISEYETVSNLVDGDFLLLDGSRGTKKLNGNYVKNMGDSIGRYEDSSDGLVPDLESSIDTMTVSGRKYIASGTYGGPESGVGLVENYVSKDNDIVQKWTGLTTHASYIRYKSNSVWSEWYRVDSGEDLFLTEWAPNTSYAAGNVRRYKNATYICKLAHTSSDQLLPTNTMYWDKKNTGTIIQDMKTTFQAGVDTIYNACVNKGQTPSSSTPSAIASAIAALVKPSGTKSITSNGTHDVSAYASASVSVPSTVYHSYETISGGSRTTRWYKYLIALRGSSSGDVTISGGTNITNGSETNLRYRINRDVPVNSSVGGAVNIGIY